MHTITYAQYTAALQRLTSHARTYSQARIAAAFAVSEVNQTLLVVQVQQ